MNIAVIGSGYVGLVVGTCLSDLGNNVIGVDIDKTKVDNLNKGIVPIYEPGLTDMLTRNLKEKRIIFTTDIKEAIHCLFDLHDIDVPEASWVAGTDTFIKCKTELENNL